MSYSTDGHVSDAKNDNNIKCTILVADILIQRFKTGR